MKDGNGRNDINVAMDIFRIGPNLPKLFEIALNKKTLFWGVSLSSDRRVQRRKILLLLKP